VLESSRMFLYAAALRARPPCTRLKYALIKAPWVQTGSGFTNFPVPVPAEFASIELKAILPVPKVCNSRRLRARLRTATFFYH